MYVSTKCSVLVLNISTKCSVLVLNIIVLMKVDSSGQLNPNAHLLIKGVMDESHYGMYAVGSWTSLIQDTSCFVVVH